MTEAQPKIETGAMKRLGEVLRFYRETRQLTTRRVADMCAVSQKDVESWEAGDTVPSNKAWGKFRGIVHRKIGEYAELRARANAEAEAREAATRAKPKFGTSLGEKLADVVIEKLVPEPEPPPPLAPEPEKPTLAVVREPTEIVSITPKKRARAGKSETVVEREQWARYQLRQRPRMPINGPDGLLMMMRKRFGIGMDHYLASRLKEEVLNEFRTLPPDVPPGAEAAPVAPAPAPAPIPVAPRVAAIRAAATDEDIETAVQLILDAVPELKTFTIKVDEQGAAHVDYEIRKVRVETVGGSMTVKPGAKP